jgi:hypothetical protein
MRSLCFPIPMLFSTVGRGIRIVLKKSGLSYACSGFYLGTLISTELIDRIFISVPNSIAIPTLYTKIPYISSLV